MPKTAKLSRGEGKALAALDRVQAKVEARKRTATSALLASAVVMKADVAMFQRLEKRGLVLLVHRAHITREGREALRKHPMTPEVRTKAADPIPEERPGYVVRREPALKIEPWRDVYVKRGSLRSPQAVHRLAEIQPRNSTILETVCGLDVPRMVSDYAYRGPGEEPWRRVKATGATCSTCRKVPR